MIYAINIYRASQKSFFFSNLYWKIPGISFLREPGRHCFLLTIIFTSIILLYPLEARETCDMLCLERKAKLVSKLNHSRTFILYGMENSLYEFNELKENEEIQSHILQEIFDMIDLSHLLESQGITIYSDLGKFLQKSGIPLQFPQILNLNILLSGSLNIREYPIDSNLTNYEKILFLRKNPPEVYRTDSPVFNGNRYSTFITKFLINKYFYYNYKKMDSSRDTNSSYYPTNSNDIKEKFKSLLPVSNSEHRGILEKIWSKQHSIHPDFPGNGYGFIEYPSRDYPGFYTISQESGEVLYIDQNLNEFIYIYNKNMSSSGLLSSLRIMIEEKERGILNISPEIPDTPSGSYIPISTPEKGYSYLYSIFHPILLDVEDSKLILKYFINESLVFEYIKNQIYMSTEQGEILLYPVANDPDTPSILHISLGKNFSFRRVEMGEYLKFVVPFFIGFIYFSFIILVHIKFKKKLNKYIKFTIFLRIKSLIFWISLSILLYLLSLLTFIVFGKYLSAKYLGYFLLSLNAFISILASILLFLLYLFFSKYRNNFARKLKYGFFLGMIFLYFYFLIRLHLLQFELAGLSFS